MRCIKMASNENPFGPSPRAVEAMRAAAKQANLYPDDGAEKLRCELAARFDINPEQVLVTAGSTELINDLARIQLAPGLNGITSRLSFIIYRTAVQAGGGRLIEVPVRDSGFDLGAIAAAIDQHTRLIYLANPNNPTGSMFDAAGLDRFLDRVPQNVIVALDEAYFDSPPISRQCEGWPIRVRWMMCAGGARTCLSCEPSPRPTDWRDCGLATVSELRS
ncbi:MAG TPA: aminotransferase class I/II-fold pyridoxal phosphate-dependent enzyme [Terriglobales bacterium]|nr:aminotransferase class I/II-fold pyridoxal phosphate-dependent enzyme [Terriglobales bacterium]